MDKPFSQACENNKQPILTQLQRFFSHARQVLEIGAGTGQHAVFFAPQLPHLHWTPSDQPQYHPGIEAWIHEYPSANLSSPIAFTVGENSWPAPTYDAVFSANTAHIMQPVEAQLMMRLIAQNLPEGGVFCQYGPFKVDGEYTSDSNAAFDQHLHEQGYGGIRDIDELRGWAEGLSLVDVVDMPANNLLLHWIK